MLYTEVPHDLKAGFVNLLSIFHFLRGSLLQSVHVTTLKKFGSLLEQGGMFRVENYPFAHLSSGHEPAQIQQRPPDSRKRVSG